jgi:hypothetical protein
MRPAGIAVTAISPGSIVTGIDHAAGRDAALAAKTPDFLAFFLSLHQTTSCSGKDAGCGVKYTHVRQCNAKSGFSGENSCCL